MDILYLVLDSEWFVVFFNVLQVVNSFDVVGQYSLNGDGGFFNFFFNQVCCWCVLQIGVQFVDFNGQYGIDQFFVVLIVVFVYQICVFGKDSVIGVLLEWIFFGIYWDKGVGDVVEVWQCQVFFL